MKTILFFISSTRHTCRDRLEGIYRYARGHDWHVQVVERAFHKVDVRRQLDFWRPIGVIAECGSGADELNNDAFGALPVVFFDADRSKRGPGFYVGSDGVSVGRLAATHLLNLKLPNYAYAAFRLPLFWDRERRDAFVSEVTKAGKGCSVFAPGREQLPHVRQTELAKWVVGLPRPCGIFAANDYVGEEIVNICEQFGLSVPDDISVLGVDNDEEICENTTTTLSSLAPDFTEGGYLAAELLGKVIANPRLKPTVIQFPVTRVVTRQSTRRMACDRRKIAEAVEMIRVRACEGLSVPDVVSYIGEPRRTLAEIGESYRESRRAVEVGRIFLPDEHIYLYRSLVLERFLMDTPRETGARYHSILFNRKNARLFNEEMLHTIEMFFAKDLNLSDTARQLYIHRNTLVYRLDKVQRQTGLDLRKFDDAVTFKMMLLLGKSGQDKPRPVY